MNIKKREGNIAKVTELGKTAREITIALNEGLECPPGSFVNVFKDVKGVRTRRAFSVVANDPEQKTLTFSIRLSPNGTMTPEFWRDDIIGEPIEIMGPMGFNTVDKLTRPKVHLFAYGIGAGVIKAVAEYARNSSHVREIAITTGSRSEEDIIYKDYFDSLAKNDPRVSVRYVLSSPHESTYPYSGYAQDYIDDLTFDDADIYMCGQEAACNSLLEKIKEKQPENVSFFVEAFH